MFYPCTEDRGQIAKLLRSIKLMLSRHNKKKRSLHLSYCNCSLSIRQAISGEEFRKASSYHKWLLHTSAEIHSVHDIACFNAVQKKEAVHTASSHTFYCVLPLYSIRHPRHSRSLAAKGLHSRTKNPCVTAIALTCVAMHAACSRRHRSGRDLYDGVLATL